MTLAAMSPAPASTRMAGGMPAAPLWERCYRRAVEGREDEIVATFLESRSDAATARALGLRTVHVRRLVDLCVPEAAVLRRARRRTALLYSDEDLLAALQAAAVELPAPVAIESYREWALRHDNGRRNPGPEVIRLRFGGWRRALARAGLTPRERSGPHARYGRSDVVEAVAAAWRELGRYPSVVRYEVWRAGRQGVPSAAIARRAAKSWDDLLAAAYPLVYDRELVYDKDRADDGRGLCDTRRATIVAAASARP